jgi:putative transposase
MKNTQHHHPDRFYALQFVTFRVQSCEDEFIKHIQASNLDESNKQFTIDQYLDLSADGLVLHGEIIDLIKLYARNLEPEFFTLIALSVMPNHVHLLGSMSQSLPECMHKLKNGLAQLINKRRQRSGAIWETDYYAKSIRDQRHFSLTYRYIKHHAEQAGLPDANRRFWGLYEDGSG